MTREKRYEVLKGLPPYGPMYIPVSGDSEPYYSEGYVVKFYKSNGEEWVANFKPGWTTYYKIFDFPKHDTIVVFAGGQGYIMDPDQPSPKMTFGLTINKVLQNQDGSLVCSDDFHILLLNNITGKFWVSDRVSWGGIKNMELIGNKLRGQTYQPGNEEWSHFELDLETKGLKGGSFREFLQSNQHLEVGTNGMLREKVQSQRRPWWKIW